MSLKDTQNDFEGEDKEVLLEKIEEVREQKLSKGTVKKLKAKKNRGHDLDEEEQDKLSRHYEAANTFNQVQDEINIRSTMVDDSRLVKYFEDKDLLADLNDNQKQLIKNPNVEIDGDRQLAENVLSDDHVLANDVALDFIWRTNRTGFCEVRRGDDVAVIRFIDE